jgi:hypothetical protein
VLPEFAQQSCNGGGIGTGQKTPVDSFAHSSTREPPTMVRFAAPRGQGEGTLFPRFAFAHRETRTGASRVGAPLHQWAEDDEA